MVSFLDLLQRGKRTDADDDVRVVERRRRDLVRIRQIYIPELIIRLHSILVTSRSRISEYAPCLLAFSLASTDADHGS